MLGPLKRSMKRIASRFHYVIVIVPPKGAAQMRSALSSERALGNHLRRLLRELSVDCVLDVGANRGQYRAFLRDTVGYEGWIVSFEPLQQNVKILREEAKNDPRWIVYEFALGKQNGYLDINVMRSDEFSSFLTPDTSLVDDFRELNVVDRKESVEIKRLDEVVPGLRASKQIRNIYLKMDTQGFDLEVIEGAGAELTDICAVQTELSVRPIYAEMPNYREVLCLLESLGFAISGMYSVSLDPAMRVIEFDCVLVKEPSPRQDPATTTSSELIKLAGESL